jgi:hypothetical protein
MLQQSCSRIETLSDCQQLDARLSAEVVKCNQAGTHDPEHCARTRQRRQEVLSALASLRRQRREAVAPASAAPERSADSAPPEGGVSKPPSNEEVQAVVNAVVAQEVRRCGTPGRRVIAHVGVSVKTDGTVERATFTTSTFPRRTSVACLETAIRAIPFKTYEMPRGKGRETECPPGIRESPMLMTQCKEVQRDFLSYVATVALEGDGTPVALSLSNSEDITPVALGSDATSVSRWGVVDYVAPREWPRDPSGSPRYCEEAPAVADPVGRVRRTGRGWCFAISCNGGEDGLIGLSGPPGPDGNEICPTQKRNPPARNPVHKE